MKENRMQNTSPIKKKKLPNPKEPRKGKISSRLYLFGDMAEW